MTTGEFRLMHDQPRLATIEQGADRFEVPVARDGVIRLEGRRAGMSTTISYTYANTVKGKVRQLEKPRSMARCLTRAISEALHA